MKKIKNKIGCCKNKYLKGVKGDKDGTHYVYISKVNNDGTCKVNTITSLEKNGKFITKKIAHIKKGNIYPIPIGDTNLSHWSGVTKTPIDNVKISNIKGIGNRYIKKRHWFYIGKTFNGKKTKKSRN